MIQATVSGTGAASSNGQLAFDPLRENQRTGLLLLNGRVYFGFSSHGDHQPYHGWILGYNATTLRQTMVFCSSPNTDSAGIWGVGGAIASDGTDLLCDTGDGPFDVNTGGRSYGDTYVRLSASGVVKDYFSPSTRPPTTPRITTSVPAACCCCPTSRVRTPTS